MADIDSPYSKCEYIFLLQAFNKNTTQGSPAMIK